MQRAVIAEGKQPDVRGLALSVGAASRREAMPQALRCAISNNCRDQTGVAFNTPTEVRLVAPTQERWSLSNVEVSNPISELPLLPPSILCLSHSPFFFYTNRPKKR